MKQTEIKLNNIIDLKQSLMTSLFSDMPQLQSVQLSWNYNRSKVGLYKINGQVFPYNEAELKDLAMSLEIDGLLLI